MTKARAQGGHGSGARRVRALLLCGACLLGTGASAAVSDHSKNWDVELAGTVRECPACEPVFELRAIGPYGETETFGVPARRATEIEAVHVSGSSAVIVQGFAGRRLHRVVFYALRGDSHVRGWSGFLAADVLAAEYAVSPDGRYVLFRPARAPGERTDPRLFLWDTATRMPGAPWPPRSDCGGPEAPCPPVPSLHLPLYPRPPAPGAEDAGEPLAYPLHAVWKPRLRDIPDSVRTPEEKRALSARHLDHLAFVALDRREWLTLVVVALNGADTAVACHVPIVPYRRDGLPGAATEEVRSVELGPHHAVVEMYGNAGVRAVHRVPIGGMACEAERDHWRGAHAERDPPRAL